MFFCNLMAEKSDLTAVNGIVTEALPNAMFRVSVKIGSEEKELISYLSGKMRMNRIRVLVGDRVSVELDPYGGKGRIIRRF